MLVTSIIFFFLSFFGFIGGAIPFGFVFLFLGFLFLYIAGEKKEKKQEEEKIGKKRKEEGIEINNKKIIDAIPDHYHLLKNGISKDLTREEIEERTGEKGKALFLLEDDEGEIHRLLCISINVNDNESTHEVEIVIFCEVFETFFNEIPDTDPHPMELVDAIATTMEPMLACAISHLYEEISLHHSALTRNLERAFTINDYGAVTQDNRTDALEEFFTSIDLPIALFGFDFASKLVYEQLDSLKAQQQEQGFDPDTLPLDGHEFESWVANALRNFGWDANVTSSSGDQGIDIIASKNNKTLGIQCKLHQNPIGNSAIQEAHAGKTFYGTHKVCVLSNAPYTPSATQLAHATNVKLFSHHDIPLLYEKTFNS